MSQSHIHTPDDGRGARRVLLDGVELKHVLYANTKRGVVRVARDPLRPDKWGKRLLERTLRGKVVVEPLL